MNQKKGKGREPFAASRCVVRGMVVLKLVKKELLDQATDGFVPNLMFIKVGFHWMKWNSQEEQPWFKLQESSGGGGASRCLKRPISALN